MACAIIEIFPSKRQRPQDVSKTLRRRVCFSEVLPTASARCMLLLNISEVSALLVSAEDNQSGRESSVSFSIFIAASTVASASRLSTSRFLSTEVISLSLSKNFSTVFFQNLPSLTQLLHLLPRFISLTIAARDDLQLHIVAIVFILTALR